MLCLIVVFVLFFVVVVVVAVVIAVIIVVVVIRPPLSCRPPLCLCHWVSAALDGAASHVSSWRARAVLASSTSPSPLERVVVVRAGIGVVAVPPRPVVVVGSPRRRHLERVVAVRAHGIGVDAIFYPLGVGAPRGLRL